MLVMPRAVRGRARAVAVVLLIRAGWRRERSPARDVRDGSRGVDLGEAHASPVFIGEYGYGGPGYYGGGNYGGGDYSGDGGGDYGGGDFGGGDFGGGDF